MLRAHPSDRVRDNGAMGKRTRPERAGTPALRVVERAGIISTVHEHAMDMEAPDLGRESARQMGLDPGRVFKTLVVDVGGRLAVGVVPVSHHLDLKALARVLGGKKAEMVAPEVAQRSSGYVVGGISPLGQRTALPTVVDDSALSHPTIVVSAGRRSLKLELAPGDLVRLCGATTARIRD